MQSVKIHARREIENDENMLCGTKDEKDAARIVRILSDEFMVHEKFFSISPPEGQYEIYYSIFMQRDAVSREQFNGIVAFLSGNPEEISVY